MTVFFIRKNVTPYKLIKIIEKARKITMKKFKRKEIIITVVDIIKLIIKINNLVEAIMPYL